MTAETLQILQDIKPDIQRIVPKGSRVLLFGSRARGDERPDSDFDILVLLDHEGRATEKDHNDVVFPMYMSLWDKDLKANVMAYTTNEWNAKKGRSLFYNNVMEDALEICR